MNKQRRPCEYLLFHGTKKNFTIVYTPHFLDRMDKRSARGDINVLCKVICIFMLEEHGIEKENDGNLN
jgi:hypothetical protein